MKALLQLVEAYTVALLNDAVRELEKQFPEVLWSGDRTSNQVALTFDDGPHERDTPALLAVLAKHGVTATFSWLGERVERMPGLVGAAAAASHQLMIHGYRHHSFLVEHPEALHAMLDRTRELLAHYSGRDPAAITCVRPPYGHLSRGLARRLLSWGYQPVICSIMPVHWLLPAELSVRQVVRQIEGGSLIVLHETLPGPPVADLTDQILTRLADRKISYVTIDTLRAERAARRGTLS